ncbi:MAG: CvpA family protein [Flavobacteriales bacterium]|nr:CvpA family protein [Flavobacteriales bacterium]
MNWLDWTILGLLAWSALKGFSRGLVVEVVSLLAVVLGVWAGLRFGPQVMGALGIEAGNALLAFIITLLLVLVGAHLLAKLITGALGLTMLSLPNKLAGALFAALRTAFAISILLGLVSGYTAGAQPAPHVREGSMLHGPVAAFAPAVLEPLGGMAWVREAAARVRSEAEGLLDNGAGTE